MRHRLMITLAILIAWLLLPAGHRARAGSVGFTTPKPQIPGRTGRDSYLLVNGRYITPAGQQTQIEPLPMNAILSPDGKHLLVTESPRADQYLQLLSTRTSRSQEIVYYPRPKGLFVGLSYSDHGHWLYASGGGQNVIHTLWVSGDGHLNPKANIQLDPTNTYDPFPIGLTTADDDRTLLVAQNHSNNVAVIRLSDDRIVAHVQAGDMPYGVVSRGTTAFVSDWATNSISVLNVPMQCGRVRPCHPKSTGSIAVGAHPCDMILHGGNLYVADANSDRISIVSTHTYKVVNSIVVKPSLHAPPGASPESLAINSAGTRLYVADSGDNAIAVIALSHNGSAGTVVGEIPTAEYPTSVTLSSNGRKLFVTDAMGDGTRPNNPPLRPYNEVAGVLSTVPIPTTASLKRYTAAVERNNHRARLLDSLSPTPTSASPWGEHMPIKHVIYIIKENQTYDAVFGDVKGANGDPQLTAYNAGITPNLHTLANRFGILDNFYNDGAASSDGHNWVMSADDDDFNEKMWPEAYSERNEYGLNPGAASMGLSPGGYLWDRADQQGVSYRDYGEFYNPPVRDTDFIPKAKALSCPGAVATRYAMLTIPKGDVLCLPPSQIQPLNYSLLGHYDPRYRGLDMMYSDLDREAEWQREFEAYVAHNDLPQLEVMWLPNDHTAGGNGYLTKDSYVAQNDRAVGLIVQAVSRSKYWKSTAIFITQDDPQGSRDHVNSERTEALIISPYTQHPHATVDSDLWDNNAMIRTMEDILGLHPMSEFDSTAQPMWAAFHRNPHPKPYTALPLAVPWTVQY